MDKALLTGGTTLLLLKLLDGEDMYGYRMIEVLRERSQNVFELKAGTLYPLLHQLEQNGLIEAYDREAGPARVRRYYHLTDSGRAHLLARQAEWRVFSSAVDGVLGGEGYAH